jgi:hypothetical protein
MAKAFLKCTVTAMRFTTTMCGNWARQSPLTLQDPVITADGYLFSKEAILQYFLDQKKEKKRQLAEWEAGGVRLQHLVIFHNGLLLVAPRSGVIWDFSIMCMLSILSALEQSIRSGIHLDRKYFSRTKRIDTKRLRSVGRREGKASKGGGA